jgi:cytochrome c551/c552
VKKLICTLMIVGMSASAIPALADDEAPCLNCHVPAEDWVGLSSDQILEDARNPENKRHKTIQALSDEQLKAMITSLLEAE